MTIEGGECDAIEVDDPDPGHARASEQRHAVRAHPSETHDDDVAASNCVLGLLAEELVISDELLLDELLGVVGRKGDGDGLL